MENGTLNATSWGDEVSRIARLPKDIHGSSDAQTSDRALSQALDKYNLL